MWFVVQYRGTTYNELKYRGKKNLESCLNKPHFCFSQLKKEQLNLFFLIILIQMTDNIFMYNHFKMFTQD